MKQKISHLRVLEITSGAEVLKSLTGIKLSYAVAKNMKALKTEAETIREQAHKSEKLDEYNKEYSELIEKEAKRDDSGNIMAAGNGVAISNPAIFKKSAKALDEKYKEELDLKKAKDKEFEAFLKDEFEFDFFQIAQGEIPETITVAQMELIFEMIKTE